jgi:hypothetical protein
MNGEMKRYPVRLRRCARLSRGVRRRRDVAVDGVASVRIATILISFAAGYARKEAREPKTGSALWLLVDS